MLQGYANKFLDQGSQYNKSMYNDYRQQALDYAGAQANQGMRMSAAGVNPFANAQYRGALAQGLESANTAYREGMRNNAQIGASFMGMANQNQMQQDAFAHQKAMWEKQKKASFTNNLLGIGGTLLGAALGGPIGGALGNGLMGMFSKAPNTYNTGTAAAPYGPQNQLLQIDTSGWGKSGFEQLPWDNFRGWV